jgi:hypothetical protein
MMVHAHVPDEFYDFALEHAWKIFNCLPIKSKNNDNPVLMGLYWTEAPSRSIPRLILPMRYRDGRSKSGLAQSLLSW